MERRDLSFRSGDDECAAWLYPATGATAAAPVVVMLRTYPGVDHFDIYDGEEFEAIVADELDFLRRRLL